MWNHRFVKVGDNNDAEVDVAGRADVSGFQAELDLGGILVQIIRTLGKLSDGDRELAVDAVVGGVFQIEPTGTEEKAHQTIVFGWLKYRIQIKGVFPISFSAVDDCGIISILFLDAVFLTGGILNLPVLAEEVIYAVISPADELEALYNSHAFTLYSSSM
mgnify:CR=1 FL=1|jgi:hypothetical protein